MLYGVCSTVGNRECVLQNRRYSTSHKKVIKYLWFGSVIVRSWFASGALLVRSRFALGTLETAVWCGSVRFIVVWSSYFWLCTHARSATRLAFVHAAATFYYTVERSSYV